MSLRIRVSGPPGATLSVTIERNRDQQDYDFSTSLFTADTPTSPTAELTEDEVIGGRFELTIASTPQAVFTDGDYTITVVNASNVCTGVESATMFGGDDTTQPPNTATVTGPVTVGSFSDGVTVPLSSHASAILYGTITNVSGVLTWHDPGTTTPRVVLTPDGFDGYTSELL